MTLVGNTSFAVTPLIGETDEKALLEPGANLVDAIEVTITDDGEVQDWTYSATAEDNGTAGNLDGQEGVIYSGPDGNYFRVKATNVDFLEHGITPPEAADTACMALFKNSEVVALADEGYNEHDAEIAVEYNVDAVVGPFNEGDVLRIGAVFTGEADGDLDVAPGELTIT